MRKFFLILLLCSSSMKAQNTNSDYQAFRKGVLDSYVGFRKTVLEDYAKYLQGIWDEYEQFKGIKMDGGLILFSSDRRTSFRLNQSNIPSGRIQVASAIYSFIYCFVFIINGKMEGLLC